MLVRALDDSLDNLFSVQEQIASAIESMLAAGEDTIPVQNGGCGTLSDADRSGCAREILHSTLLHRTADRLGHIEAAAE